MAKETQIGQLVIDLKIKTEALEKGLETAKKKLENIEEENKKVQNSNKQLDASFLAMSAGIVASLVKIKSAIDNGVEKYKQYESANKGLESIVKGQGLNFNKAKSFIEDYISDGLIPLNEATLAYKNLASRGYNEEQIQKTMTILKDTAAFGRQSTYEYGEAIATATEGLKNENSILVDNAGVTKNVAKMWQDYAKSIGKTTESLTQEEKILAEVNGIEEESKNQIGDATKYAETYAGQQAKLNASSIELGKTLGETMVPTLTEINSLGLQGIQILNSLLQNNKSATVGTVTFVTSLGTLVLGITSVIKVMQMYKTAVDTLNISTKALKVTMASAFAVSAVLTAITAVVTAIREQEETQKRLNEEQEFYNQIVSKTIQLNNENVNAIEAKKKAMEDYLEDLQKYRDMGGDVNEDEIDLADLNEQSLELDHLRQNLKKTSDEYKKIFNIQKEGLLTNEDLNGELQTYTNALKEANAVEKIKNAMDTESVKRQKQEAAQLKINADEMQNYLNIVKRNDKSTSEYQNAVKKLAETYPEAANAQGIIIDQAQDFINSEKAKADQSWNTVQEIINGNSQVIQKYIEMAQEAEGNVNKQQELANSIGIAYADIVPTLTSVLNIITAIGNQTPEQVPNIKPTSTYTPRRSSGGSSSKTYSNKALDNYKKEIEYKKSLDKLSLKDEIKMYQTALNKYAKTTDEKREIRVKLYELEKELNEETLENYTANIEHKKALDQISLEEEIKSYEYAYKKLAKTTEQKKELEENLYELRKELAQKQTDLLNEQTKQIESNMKKREQLEGASYTAKDKEKDYDKLIKVHSNYLAQILADERLSLEERRQIYNEELDIIKDYEEQKRNLRVQSIDNTVSQLKSAILKQLEEMQDADKKAIEKNIELVEKWKDTRINAINEEYNTRIEAIQKELDLLDKSEEEKTRAEEDAEYQRKRNRLQQLIDYEHDAVNKANYQKELDKLVTDYQKTLDKRALSDQKEALKEKQDLLKEEQSAKVEAIETEAEKQKTQYQTQLDELDKYYKAQQEKAQETAEKMLLNVDDNQKEILKLLKNYGDAYEITGQSLGEKLAQGISGGLADKIETAIKNIQKKIDKGINSKITSWMPSAYQAQASSKSVESSSNVNVTQNNYIQQNPEMPSETYRKLRDVQRALADQLAGA